jgi:Uma2 family endonuclease
MSAVAEKTEISPEELLRMPDRKNFELVDGELLEQKVSILSSWIGGELFGLIRDFCGSRQMGWVFPPDSGFQCFPDRPKTVRKPDVSFVKTGRMTWDQLTDGWLRIVPDLIVEVISPNDLAYEVDEKIEMFLKVGVPLIWIVNPDVRTIRILRADGSTSILREGDELTGEDILPGFTCSVASIFPPKPSPPAIAAPPA